MFDIGPTLSRDAIASLPSDPGGYRRSWGASAFRGCGTAIPQARFIARCGQIIDATWPQKHGKSHHGYKLNINVDKRYKVIRKIETDTASTHDSQHFDAVLDPSNTSRDVYADKGYPGAEREARYKADGYRNHIQRKGQRNRPLSECQQQRNKRIVKTRARVKNIFGAIEQMGDKLIRTIGQIRANFAMTMMSACYNLKLLTYLKRAGIEVF